MSYTGYVLKHLSNQEYVPIFLHNWLKLDHISPFKNGGRVNYNYESGTCTEELQELKKLDTTINSNLSNYIDPAVDLNSTHEGDSTIISQGMGSGPSVEESALDNTPRSISINAVSHSLNTNQTGSQVSRNINLFNP